jgi:uncharacterized membrane protein YbhN (UPF0104 family)
MSDATAPTPAAAPPERPSVGRRLWRAVRLLLVLLAVVVVGDLLGIDVLGWIGEIWTRMLEVDPIYIVAACALQTVQTALTALPLRNILRASYPDQEITFKFAFGTYAASVAGNSILPANGGTLIMLGLWRVVIPASSFATFVAVLAVHSLGFAVFQGLTYLYILFSPAEGLNGAIEQESGFLTWVAANPWLSLGIVLAAAVVSALLVHRFWPKLRRTLSRLAAGAVILRTPSKYAVQVLVPQALSFLVRLAKAAVLMQAFGIPVTLRSVLLVTVASSLAGAFQVTPGGLGTKQAMDCVALSGYTDCTTATSWSLSQQAIVTAWNLVLGAGGLIWAFGWSDTKDLVKRRKELVADVRAQRDGEAAPGEAVVAEP